MHVYISQMYNNVPLFILFSFSKNQINYNGFKTITEHKYHLKKGNKPSSSGKRSLFGDLVL